jgi:hypothetical protein
MALGRTNPDAVEWLLFEIATRDGIEVFSRNGLAG